MSEFERFPSTAKMVRAKWAPVFLSPILGSPERFVIGVAAVSESGFHVEAANALRRLRCLYGKDAETATFAAEVAIDALQADIRTRGLTALLEPVSAFSGVTIGPISEGEANSVEQIAQAWMSSLSSLYRPDAETDTNVVSEQDIAAAEAAVTVRDRLPALVLKYVSDRRPGLEEFFSEDLREQPAKRRGRTKAHGVIIDFAGSRMVANFGTLMAANRSASVDKIKRRIFDLMVGRDTEKSSIAQRAHRMIVQHPAADDPQIGERQYAEIEEALDSLSSQAGTEEIAFAPFTSVPLIGDYILAGESRAVG